MLKFFFKRNYNKVDFYSLIGCAYILYKGHYIGGVAFLLVGLTVSVIGEQALETRGF